MREEETLYIRFPLMLPNARSGTIPLAQVVGRIQEADKIAKKVVIPESDTYIM